jgi:drug/metabolite transporter (DMT)-like permease
MALFGVIVYHLALNTGEQSVSAGTASLIMALNPAFIFLLSVVSRRESFSPSKLAGLGIAFAGLFIVVRFASGSELSFGFLRGVLITVLAPLSWALYTVLSRPVVAEHPPLAVTGLATILGTLPLLGFARPSLGQAMATMHWDGWASIAFLAIFCTVVGVTVWVVALQYLPASEVGAFIYLVPLWSAVLSRFFLGEPLTLPLLFGAAVVIGGVMIVNQD